MITCPICQSENEVGFTECILCGAPLPTEEETNAEAAPSLQTPEEVVAPSAPAQAPSPPLPLEPSPLASGPTPAQAGPAMTVPPPSLMQDSSHLLSSLPTSSSGSSTPHSAMDPIVSTQPAPIYEQSHLPTPEEIPQTTRSPEHTVPTSQAEIPAQPVIPPSGTLCLIVYFERRPAYYLPVIYDEILIGRTDPASNAYPDMDVTPFDPELAISRKHCYLYREGEEYFIYPISNSGTQVNQEMIDIGTKKRLHEGDVIILSGRLAIRFTRIQ